MSTKEMETSGLTNFDKAVGELDDIKKGVGDITIRLSARKIENQMDMDHGTMLLKEANLALKKFDLKLEELVRAPKHYIEKIRDTVKAIKAPIESAMSELKNRGNDWVREENARKQKELEKLAQQRAKDEQKVVSANTTKEQAAAINKANKTQEKIETVAATKVTGVTRRRKFEVTDPALVPRDYLIVDESKIRSAMGKVGEGIPTIPGVRIWDDQEMRA